MKALTEVFEAAGVQGFLHARDIDDESAEVCLGADDPVVLASVFKIPIVLEYARQAALGRLDPLARLTITAADKDGGIGTSGCADDVELSVRDVARLMMTLSDNAATDVLLRHVGLANVQALFGTLKSLIWRDEAGPGQACAEVRAIMGAQVWPHRLASGFPDEVRVSGKTGTLFSVRNEVAAVEYPDGRRFAVAVFLRSESLAFRQPRADAAIGQAARLAVDFLR